MKRVEVIAALKSGATLVESQWGGYHYWIRYAACGKSTTVTFATARHLITNNLVVEVGPILASGLMKDFRWNNGQS